MEENVMENAGRGSTKMCSVLFVDIVGYSKKTNAEQIVLKQTFVDLWTKAMKEVPPDDVMVVDAGDGAALTALVEPEDTIRVAMALRDAATEYNKTHDPIDIRMGINFGPVQLSRDVHGKACIVGDAINIAQRVMSFADPGQITISRSYYDILKPLAHKYGDMFYYLGQRSDKHVRYHHIYGLGTPGQSGPLGNATSESIRPLKPEEPEEEKTSARQVKEAKPAAPEKPAVPKVSFFTKLGRFISAFIGGIWNFFARTLRSITRFIRKWVRWITVVGTIALIAYELLVLMPIVDKPDAIKKELGGQVAAVTGFLKSGFGLAKKQAQEAMAEVEKNKAANQSGNSDTPSDANKDKSKQKSGSSDR